MFGWGKACRMLLAGFGGGLQTLMSGMLQHSWTDLVGVSRLVGFKHNSILCVCVCVRVHATFAKLSGRGSCYGSKTCFWDFLSISRSNDKGVNCRTF